MLQRKSSAGSDEPKKHQSPASIGREDGFGLWKEAEIHAVAKEVNTKKSVDTSKLFSSTSSGLLPTPLNERTKAEVVSLVDRLKASYNSSVSSWAPKFGVPELLCALSAEAFFVRTSLEQLAPLCTEFDKVKEECSALVQHCAEASQKSKKLLNQVSVESKRREGAEACKAVGEESAAEVKKEIEEGMQENEDLNADLNTFRLNELEARRRLDRSRLKVAALRGEMITTTVDVLERPPPKWLTQVGESLTSAESGDREDGAGRNSNRSSGFSSVNGEMAKKAADEDGDAAMKEDENELSDNENPESVDMEVALSDAEEEEDEEDEEAVETDESAEEDDDTGFDEDGVRMELRLLKYRLDMYEFEAAEWRNSSEAELVKIGMVTKAKARQEEELARFKAKAHGSDRRSRARRAAPVAVEPVPEPEERPAKRRRKGIARKSLSNPLPQ